MPTNCSDSLRIWLKTICSDLQHLLKQFGTIQSDDSEHQILNPKFLNPLVNKTKKNIIFHFLIENCFSSTQFLDNFRSKKCTSEGFAGSISTVTWCYSDVQHKILYDRSKILLMTSCNQCSKFSAEVTAQVKKLDGAPDAQFWKILWIEKLTTFLQNKRNCMSWYYIWNDVYWRYKDKSHFCNYILGQCTINKRLKFFNNFAKNAHYISAPFELQNSVAQAKNNSTAQRHSLNTGCNMHHSLIVIQNNIILSFVIIKMTKCWNFHVDRLNNNKYNGGDDENMSRHRFNVGSDCYYLVDIMAICNLILFKLKWR